jgi:predicted MFS family arabinose efflux permease
MTSLATGSSASEAIRAGELQRGWPVIIACMLGLMFGLASIAIFSFGTFVLPVGSEMGWNRAQMSGAITSYEYGLAIGSLGFGFLIDRIGARIVILTGIFILALLTASLALLTHNLLHLYAVYGAMGLLTVGTTPVGYNRILIEWFDKRRGLALGLALIGAGLGATVMPPLSQKLIAAFGWRTTFVCLAVIIFLVTWPTGYFLLKARPDGQAADRRAARPPLHAGVFTSRLFLTLAVISLLFGLITVGTYSHLGPMLHDRGYDARTSAFIISISGIALIVARGSVGWILDYLYAPYVVAVVALAAVPAIFLLEFGGGDAALYAATFLVGFVLGAEYDLVGFLVSRYYDKANFGGLFGVIYCILVCGSGTGPILIGLSFVHFGNYTVGLVAFAGLAVLLAVLALTLPRYQRAA